MSFEFSDRTKQILANFSTINPAILFRVGNQIRTVSPLKDMFAIATVTEDMPKEFAIYDLSRFLGVLSMFEKPQIKFNDGELILREGKRQVNYVYASLNMIEAAPAEDFEFPPTIAQFELPEKELVDLNKMLGFMKFPNVVFQSNGKIIVLRAFDPENPTGDSYTSKVGESDKAFNVIFNADKLGKLMTPDTYKVTIGYGDVNGVDLGLTTFESKDVKYLVGAEENSQYE